MNLLDLVLQRNLNPAPRKVSGTHGGEWHSPCPVCGGKDRFHFWPLRPSTGSCTITGVWGCRSCDKSGDAIGFLMHADGIGFKDACKRLNQPIPEQRYKPVRLPQGGGSGAQIEPQDEPALPNPTWMQKNGSLVAYAHETLLQTQEQLAWLAARGLDVDAVKRFRLGWLPGGQKDRAVYWYTRALAAWGLPVDENVKGKNGKPKNAFSFARGLIIPRFAYVNGQEQVTGLRIRRPNADREQGAGGLPDLKYQAFKGARIAPMLIPPRSYAAPYVIMVVESELDAMLVAVLASSLGINLGVLALCSNTARPTVSQHKVLQRASRVLLCLDFDPDGSGGKEYTDKALHKWLATYPAAQDWPVPQGKDPGDAYALGADMPVWLMAALPESCIPRAFRPVQTPPASPSVEAPESTPVAEAPADPVQSPPAAIAPAQLVEGFPDVSALYALMLDHNLKIRVGQGSLGLDIPVGWAFEHQQELAQASHLLFHSEEVAYWLDTHSVQAGYISAQNFMLRQSANMNMESK
ncbi:hypothetical protein LJC48_01260 [Desulfovibrio sp. OttesenSCG-928-C06]|nr:hypothetical protein [Desulfovibrio sp. OttesenSCG-928-C06]